MKEDCCVLGPRLPLGRALERLTIGLGTTSHVGEIKPSSKVESVVVCHYLPTRSVTTKIIGVTTATFAVVKRKPEK